MKAVGFCFTMLLQSAWVLKNPINNYILVAYIWKLCL